MKKLLVIAVVMLASLLSINAAQIDWGNGVEIYKASGATNLVLDGDISYFIRIYEAGANNTIDFSIVSGAISLGVDDIYTGIQFNWNSGGADGFCYTNLFNADTTYGINAGDRFYSVIFDTSIIAGNCAIVDATPSIASYPGGMMTYDPGGVTGGMQGSGGDWQAIPEPATALLFSLGGMGAWILRRNKQKVRDEDEEIED